MKKITLTIGTLLGMLFTNNNTAHAQSSFGQVSINAGIGYSVLFPVISALEVSTVNSNNASNGTNTGLTYVVSPAYTGIIDVGLATDFSLGLCLGYQNTVLNYTDYQNSITGQLESCQEIVTRVNYGLRGLWHFVDDKNVDAYLGGRVGYSIWTDVDNSNDPNFNTIKGNLNLPSFQGLIGVRLYLVDEVALHVELAVGTPYLIEGGLTFRFGSSQPEK